MSLFELKDKIAIVTGGAGGIGTCIALQYAKAGANVVAVSRNQENLDKVAAEIKALGRESLAIATDVCIPEQVDNMVKQTVDRFGRIDIMVNNAGRGSLPVMPEELSFEDWNTIIALNLTGPFLCSIAAGKVMIEQKSGKIINISSTAGIKGSPGMAHYGAAKAGVINLTKSLANAWAQHNINVNCIAPGLTATPGLKSAGWMPPDKTEDGTPVPPLQFPHGPEEVANLALFLASALSDHISGELIPIRGSVALDH
ncbi:MAG TPA: glucose 1-dehydrogenase [Dehalococcoidales bacterium]|nr:glucose 1-dehydrogenase [Dehalococcoidales bacterium]